MPTVRDIVVRKPTEQETRRCGSWPTWTCEPTITDGKESVTFGPGDMVVFPEGLECVWNVKEAIRKHYNFG